MAGPRRDDSLQQLLRARRGTKSLLSVEELRRREAEREREAAQAAARAEAARLAAERRAHGTPPATTDGDVLRALHAIDPDAYLATTHWRRLARAQLRLAPACEAARCGATDRLRAHHVTLRTLGAEEPGRDLVTLCSRCGRRAAARARARGRPLARDEVRTLAGEGLLFDRVSIAALRERYSEPPQPPQPPADG
ncbi:MAG TPA: hypothetical protein VEY87_10015 [Gaiellaceae bacterium]|nr:hypothetical protein [Gaiellaceae bacterium]